MERKKQLASSLFISVCLVITPISMQAKSVVETCRISSSQAFGFAGDVSGKRISTKETFYYDCSKTTTEQGACKDNVVTTEAFDTGKIKQVSAYYETEDFSGSMGGLMSIAQAYDKINNLWGGWRGFCQTGKPNGNFDWLSDPYFLAGAALSAVGAGAAAKASSAATAANTAGQAANSTATSVETLAAQNAAQAAQVAYQTSKIVNYAICAANAGIETAKIVKNYNSEEPGCNPVDEMCDEEDDGTKDSQIYTLPEEKYNDFITASPDAISYMKIISGQGTGVVKVKISAAPADGTAGVSSAKMEEIKMLIVKIQGAMMTLSLATCLSSVALSSSGGGTTGGSASSEAELLSTKNITTTTLGAINPLLGLTSTVVFNTVEGLQDIDTCRNKSDADEKGSRHAATFEAQKNDLCHFVSEKTTGKAPIDNRKYYSYCCYDHTITKTLVEQVKAQLLHDWKNCTGITFKELANVSFEPCDAAALDAAVDGTKLSATATMTERQQAYQFTHRCIDIREYMAYMKTTFGGDDVLIDDVSLRESLNQMKVQ